VNSVRPRVRQASIAAAMWCVLACGGTIPSTDPAPAPATPRPAPPRQDSATTIVPAGYGTLRQEDVAIRMQVGQVQIRAIPLDESVIRVLAPDSYRSLRGLRESRRDAVERMAGRYLLRERNVWLVSFYGLAPEARFSPSELTLTVSGRDYRPLEVLPLSSGFGEQRLQQHETQTALYLFPDGVNLSQPLTARIENVQDGSWAETLRRIDQERALIRGRASRGTPSP
jgi:hypothetical protein